MNSKLQNSEERRTNYTKGRSKDNIEVVVCVTAKWGYASRLDGGDGSTSACGVRNESGGRAAKVTTAAELMGISLVIR
jgi:hypothetical protein